MKLLDYLGLTSLSEIIKQIRGATKTNASNITTLGEDFSTFANEVNATFEEVDQYLDSVQRIEIDRW